MERFSGNATNQAGQAAAGSNGKCPILAEFAAIFSEKWPAWPVESALGVHFHESYYAPATVPGECREPPAILSRASVPNHSRAAPIHPTLSIH
ncbi:MAG: hypothetical protein AB7O59_02405 [Pirellulales bacterium]